MCLLISQTNSKPIKRELLENADCSNPDGMGFAYADNGQIQVEKFRDFKPFYKAYKSAVKRCGKVSNFIVHFRFSTHGVNTGLFNIHPFRVNERLVFAHNGVLDVDDHKKKSDTRVFNETILQKLKPNFLNSSAVCSLIEGFIGSDKLVFLNNDGKNTIINEKRGHWDNGVWYSNSSYKPYKAVKYGYSNYECVSGYNYPATTKAFSTYGKCNFCQVWGKLNSETAGGNDVKLCDTCKGYNSV